ncbi:MAG: hypothetical protein M3M87_03230 [Thermoproteota archaeon]|nr:hypothetical protein [Thermoproteota archaeon]
MNFCNIKLLFYIELLTEMEKDSNTAGGDSIRNDFVKTDVSNNNNNNNNNNHEAAAEVLEKGDIFFFYRPKAKMVDDGSGGDVKSIEDIRRFFMVTASTTTTAAADNTRSKDQEQPNNTNRTTSKEEGESSRYRLFVIGKKSLPEVRTTEARRSERYWAKVGGIFENPQELTSELLADEFRKGDAARPVGEGKYAIVKHQDHAELAYVLEMPEEPGEAQRELGIEKEASYIISIINPKVPVPAGYPSSEEPPNYPESILKEFGQNENFVSLARDLRFINFQNAQMILVGAREGKDVIQKEFGIDIKEEKETVHSADVFSKLKIEKDRVPIKALIEGKFE